MWLIFDILKTPHLKLGKIITILIIIKISYNYPLCFWSKILVGHPIDILKHVIGQMHVKDEKFQFEMKLDKIKNDENHNVHFKFYKMKISCVMEDFVHLSTFKFFI
jgi:hypothetical protein